MARSRFTGATQTMGEAIAHRLAADGAAILGVGRNENRGRAVADSLIANGDKADFIRADVGVEDQVAAAVATALERFGGLDIVVNNAAALDSSTPESPAHLESTELFDMIMKVNLHGPFWFAKYAIPTMLASGGGSVINISSYSAQRGVGGIPGLHGQQGCPRSAHAPNRSRLCRTRYPANTIVLGNVGTAEFGATPG